MALPIFPTLQGMAWQITRKNNGFGNARQKSVSGMRTDIPSRNIPTYTWTIPFEFLRDYSSLLFSTFSDASTFSDGSGLSQELALELQTLDGFWNQTFAGATPFLYLDPADSFVKNQVIGIGDGATVAFQAIRTFGGFSVPVYSLKDDAKIIVNDALLTVGVDYSISETGLVTFFAAPADGVTIVWAGTYYWRCRFDDDALEFENFMQGLWTLKKLAFSSELFP